jgi:hypothetical protein
VNLAINKLKRINKKVTSMESLNTLSLGLKDKKIKAMLIMNANIENTIEGRNGKYQYNGQPL